MTDHPVRLVVDDDLRRSRLTVFFRLPLAFPHIVWATLWGYAAEIAAVLNWIATLVLGRSPHLLQRFISAYIRYQAHYSAFLFLIGNPFPGFVGAPGSYPIDLQLSVGERQRRLITLFRLLLALPALIVASVLFVLLYVVAFFGWFAALAVGRMPQGLRDAGAYAIGYTGQLYAYLYVLTDRYPNASPSALLATTRPPAGPEPESGR